MQINSQSVARTLNIGEKIAKVFKKGDIVCLFGQLGSGKTVLTKGIAKGLGIKISQVISPTFVLMRQHAGRIPFFHFDLYRINLPQDILGLGYEEYLYDDGITVIEWADRLKYLLPKEYLRIELLIKGKQQRLLKINAFGKHYQDLLLKINENISY